MRAMMQFRIGNAPTRSARRRKFSSCMAYLDIVLHQDCQVEKSSSPRQVPYFREPFQPRMPKAASRPVVVTRIPSTCTGPTTAGPDGSTKPTTKTISEEIARECQKRIENYKELQKKIDKTVANALDQAPWTQEQKK